MTVLVATCAMPGARPAGRGGGIFLVDVVGREVRSALPAGSLEADRGGGEAGAHFRGVAFHEETVLVAGGDRLFAFTPEFRLLGSWRNPYLKGCEEICVYQGQVFLASAGFDSILAFDIGKRQFHWAMCVEPEEFRFRTRIFDPRLDDGPVPIDRMHLNSVVASDDGMYLAGLRTGGLLHFNGRQVSMSASLPAGTHNAQPYDGGVLFNDTEAGVVRFAAPDPERERVFRVPESPGARVAEPAAAPGSRAAGAAPGRGLCVVKDGLVAGGSAAATVALHDLDSGRTALTVSFAAGPGNAIRGLEVWPYA